MELEKSNPVTKMTKTKKQTIDWREKNSILTFENLYLDFANLQQPLTEHNQQSDKTHIK